MPGRSDILAGKAVVMLVADDSALVRGLMRAQQRLRMFGQSIQATGGMFAAAGTAILAPLGAMVHGFLSAGDALDKMRQRTGLSVQSLSELQHAANQSGASIEAVEKAVRKMQQEVGAAGEPTKELSDSLEFLGVTLDELRALDPEQQFELLAKRIGAIADPTQRAAMAVAIFGRGGTALLPMIEDMDSLRQEARDLGLTMSGEAAAAAVKLGDQLANLWTTVRFMGHSLAATLAEPLMDLATKMQKIITTTLHWVQENRQFVIAAAKAAVGVTAFGLALMGIGTASLVASTAIGGVISTLQLLRGSLALTMGAVKLFSGVGVAMWGGIAKAASLAIGTFTLQLGLFASAQAFVLSILGSVAGFVASAFSPVGLAIAGVVAVVAAAGVAFWKLADPLTALMPLFSAVATAAKGIFSALLSGDFAGAFEVIATSIRTIMFGAMRAVIDMARNTLTNLIGFVSGAGGGIGGALSPIMAAIKRIFSEVWESGKIAVAAMMSFLGDAFSQAPAIIGYAFGLAIRKVVDGVNKLKQWMGQVFVGFVTTIYSSFANLGPGLIRAMLTGDIAGAMGAIGPAIQKALAAQALAAGGLASGLFGGEMPEFKISPATESAYAKMADAMKATGAASTPSAGETPTTPGAVATGAATRGEATPGEKPTLPVSELKQYQDRLKELSDAFDAGTITQDEFAADMEDLKKSTLGIDPTPAQQYQARLLLLNQALADGTINQNEWRHAVEDAKGEIFQLATSPLDDFKKRVLELQLAFASGAIGPKEYGEQLAIAKREILGLETSQLEQFGARVKELREQLAAGAISKTEFDTAFASSQKDFLGIAANPIDEFKEKLVDLRKALQDGLITKDQFKLAAMEALPQRVKSIIDETRTPLEKYKKDMAELDQLKKAGLIDQITYDRKAGQLKKTISEQNKPSEQTGKSNAFGSFSAFSLIDQGRAAGTSKEDKLAKLLEQGKTLTESQLTELQTLRKALETLVAGMIAR